MAGGDEWVCTANTPSNPDISGIGVISAFITQAVLSNLLGWYMYLFHPSPTSTSPSSSPATPATPAPSSRALKFIQTLRTPLLTPMLKHLILLITDTQNLTGISLLIASFTQPMAAYHAVIVVSIAWMPSLSHHIAMHYVYPIFILSARRRRRDRAMRGVRLGIVALYVILYTAFCAKTFVHVRSRWDTECFATCKGCTGSRQEMRQLIYWIVTGLGIFLVGYMPFVLVVVRPPERSSPPQCEARESRGCVRAAMALLACFAKRAWAGLTSVPASLVMMSFWIAFTAFGISEYRAGCGIGEEERWGFGQVLAVLGLVIVVFEGIKGFCGLSLFSFHSVVGVGMRANCG
ncbi:hypothetical protein L873DRAFT_1815562 [Choiromyces venosus 120613-1]|uniref:Uncharacterized protein n=1 Tax=Choiromyces venosus 120613-1 TaxID=1336337 RepID=A0A3N4J5L0_9PEZI|nr:hypothetical protein L873DRAFT_1815562 [Choiromyces venosus 120613-1]